MRRLSQRSVECAIVGVPTLAVFVWWTLDAGGYFERQWMPGMLLVLVMAASSVVAQRRDVSVPGYAAALALATFAAYVAWSFLSILWADAPADALSGSLRALAYLVCFAAFVLLAWTSRTLLAAVLAFVTAMTAIAVATLVRLGGLERVADRFVDGSLLGPVGYHNASAALFAMAGVPALMLAARREVVVWLRPLLLAAATLLLATAGLGQSRALLLAAPVIAGVALLLSPDRLRLALFAAPVVAALGLAAADVLALGRAGAGLAPAEAEPGLRAALDDALAMLALVTAATLVAGAVLVAVERRLGARPALGPDRRRALSRALVAAVATSAIGAALVATDGRPLDRAQTAWSEFTDVEYAATSSTGLGSGRYDFWRVALAAWREHPLLGVGQDNFIEIYAEHRRTGEEPRWVHSLPLRLLTHTGLAGALLFVAFLAALARGVAQTWRTAAPGTAAVVGAACMPAVIWLAHGTVDWLWEVPALSLAALALAGAALALGRHRTATPPRSARTQRIIAGASVAATIAIAAAVVPAFVADREVAVAAQIAVREPAAAYARLERAAALNPLSPDPGLAAGRIAVRAGDLRRARRGFADAARRAPRAWYPRFALGLVASATGNGAEARRQLRAARARNPRERLVADALRRAGGPRPLGFAEAQRRLDAQRRVQRARRG